MKHTLRLHRLNGDRAVFSKWVSNSPSGRPGVELTRVMLLEDWRDAGRPVDLDVDL